MEPGARDGDSPVRENGQPGWIHAPSTGGHVEPARNPARPRAKAKHLLTTDSAQVLRRKVEKNPGEGSEIVPETVSLQAVGAPCEMAKAYLTG